MGEPMIERLIAAGYEVHVYARRPEIQDRLRKRGAAVAPSIAELGARSDILISCVFSDDQLREISSGPEGFTRHLRPGTILVSHTTGSRSTLTEIVEAGDGISVVDAPVSGTSQHIAEGKLTVLLGGPDEAVERVSPILGAYADPVIRTGELGSALAIKLVNNLLFATNMQTLAAASGLAEKLNVDGARLLEVLAVCSGGSRAADYARQFGGVNILGPAIGPVMRKDVDAAAAAAAEYGVDLGLLATAVESGPLTYSAK